MMGARLCRRLVLAALLGAPPLVATPLAWAQTITVAVENKDFAPYTTWSGKTAGGACAEIVEGAVRQMGGTVEYVGVPWSRVLWMVQRQKVDAALCGTFSEDRAAYSFYPQERLLDYDATVFVRSASRVRQLDAGTATGLTFGVIIGYSYSGADQELERMGMIRREVLSRDILLRHLVSGKLDTALDSVLPVKAEMTRLGLKGKIRALTPSLRKTPAYLFFSRRDGHEALAQRFSEALKAFKETPDYLEIAERYGVF